MPVSGDLALTPSAVLGLQRVVGNANVGRLLAARGSGAVVQREFEPGWRVRSHSADAPNDLGFNSLLLKGNELEVDQATTRMHEKKVQVRAKSEEMYFTGWVNLHDVQDPKEATAVYDAESLGKESTRAAKESMAARLDLDVATMISEQQSVHVRTTTVLPDGGNVAANDAGTVMGRLPKPEFVFDEADEWPTLLVRLDKCQDTALHGKVVELRLSDLVTAADTQEKEEQQERRETNRVMLTDAQVEEAVVGDKLAAYTANKGIKLEGKIHYLEEGALKQAFIDSEIRERQAENARGDLTDWTMQAELYYLKSNPTGFRDGEEIYVRADRKGFGTEIHEAIHRYSSRNVLENIGFDFSEGLTEYFTRLITEGWIERGDEYYFQLNMINELVEASILSHADLADMYFNGAADLLVKRMTDKLGHAFRYSAFMSLVNNKNISDALTYVRVRPGGQRTSTGSGRAGAGREGEVHGGGRPRRPLRVTRRAAWHEEVDEEGPRGRGQGLVARSSFHVWSRRDLMSA